MDKNTFISAINQYDMIASRFLTNTKFDNAKAIINQTKDLFESHRKKYPNEIILEALEIIIHHYGEFQSKIPLKSDFGLFITEHLFYYIEERKKMTKGRIPF
jgi:hypothetical protein